MKPRQLIPFALLACLILGLGSIDAAEKPNVVLFLVDDMAQGAFHFSTSPVGVPPPPPGQSQASGEQVQAANRWFWSEEFWNVNQSGKWFLLATTVDRRQQNPVTHYINGRRVGFSGGNNTDQPLPKMRIGDADLGNWTDPIRPEFHAIRSLNGRIDEFALYSVALTADEIRTIYMQGRP